MQRRTCLTFLTAAALASTTRAVAADASSKGSAWAAWKTAFLQSDGRVVDPEQKGVSHSEGQSYGMLLAVAFGDHDSFEAMRLWTETHLAIRRDPLLAWRWEPGHADTSRDYNNATDGDLFQAWALLRAARAFDTPAYLDRAREIALAIDRICIVADPRANDRLLLLPGAERFVSGDTITVNPSYYMSRALHELAAVFDAPRLAQCADDGETLTREIANSGLVPDWVEISPEGWWPSVVYSGRHGYDALRYALYMIWSARVGHPAVARSKAALERHALANTGTPVVLDLDGSNVLEFSDLEGYAAVSALVRCSATAAGEATVPCYSSGQPYYPATLHLLTLLAARDAIPTCARCG